ncbi:hypothetical protein J6590_066883 [Homalodisca vitripennis]|uniref:Uncharacterized protein n=1 Tax=Homalodisca liturata TaxID=320908 RepID=A0A1B6JRR5_9HEMI|nr:hypothetical protein J6590_066883 [Homalodisca vitripennis]
MESCDVFVIFLCLSVHMCCGSIDKLRFLETVDDRIIELLAKPKKRNAEFILDQIDLYNHCLFNIIEIMRLRTPDFLETCRSFIDTRGPACIQQPIDEQYLKQGFDWNDEKLYEFQLLFTQTFNLWDLFLETFMTAKVDYRTYVATEGPVSDEDDVKL